MHDTDEPLCERISRELAASSKYQSIAALSAETRPDDQSYPRINHNRRVRPGGCAAAKQIR